MTIDRRVIIIIAFLAAAALFFAGWQCHNSRIKKSAGTVKVITKDSLVYVDRPKPYRVDSIIHINGKDGKTVYDTLWGPPEVIIEPADTNAILKRFYDVAYYKREVDSGRFKITVLDTVSQNRIQGGSIRATSYDTNSQTTLIKTLPRKFVAYWTTGVGWTIPSVIPRSGAVGVALKFPGDMVVQAEMEGVRVPQAVNKHGVIGIVSGRVFFPIRKRKK